MFLGLTSLPAYYVLDKQHVVRYRGDDHRRAATIAKTLLGVSRAAAAPAPQVSDMVAGAFKMWDANEDRRLERSELPDELREQMRAADLNGDGVMTVEEMTAHLKNAVIVTETVPVK